MSHLKYSAKFALLAVVSMAVLGLSIAPSSATTPARLTPHRVYVATSSRLRISFISHSPTVIDEASAGLGGSQYIEGSVLTNCPAVSSKALTSPGYPRIVLRDIHGFYSFTLSYGVANVNAGYPGQTDKTLPSVHVRITGKVENANVIAGTVQFTGAPCTTPSLPYTARINPSFTKEISPDA